MNTVAELGEMIAELLAAGAGSLVVTMNENIVTIEEPEADYSVEVEIPKMALALEKRDWQRRDLNLRPRAYEPSAQ